MTEMIEETEGTEVIDQEETLKETSTEREETDQSNATIARKMVILPKIAKMKKLKDLTEAQIKASDAINVRNSVIWPKTVPSQEATVRDQERISVVSKETIEIVERRSVSSAKDQVILLKNVMYNESEFFP